MTIFRNQKVISTLLFIGLSATTLVLYQNCSGGGGGGGSAVSKSAAPAGLGTFVDDPVAGVQYKTSSGLTGVTNSLGQFEFNPGDTVTFYALGAQLGSATPTIGTDGNTTVSPIDLVPSANGNVSDPQVTAIAQVLNTLNAVSAAQNNTATGVFTMPSGNTQLQGLQIPSSTSTDAQQQAFASQLASLLQTAFPSLTITVTSATDATTALQQGLSSQGFIGTVWNAASKASAPADQHHAVRAIHHQPGRMDRVANRPGRRDRARGQGCPIHDRGIKLVIAGSIEHRAPSGVEAGIILQGRDRAFDGIEPREPPRARIDQAAARAWRRPCRAT